MATTYIALFRGINIGGRHQLPMKTLTSLIEGLGCRNVQTYIQSGNLLFDTNNRNRTALAGDISKAVFTRYHFSPTVLLLTEKELLSVIHNNPFPTDKGTALHFLFLASQPTAPNIARLDQLKTATEQYKLGDKVFYLYAPDGVGRSKLAANVEKCLGVATTGRNWNTVSRLVNIAGNRG